MNDFITNKFFDSYVFHAVTILVIMIAGGTLGGFASYFLSESKEKTKTKSIVLGITAATIVPVFLKFIDKNFLDSVVIELESLFVFFGLCTLVAVFSRNFLENIYNKVLLQVGDMDEKMQKIVESSEEIDILNLHAPNAFLEKHKITEDEFNLLQAFLVDGFTYRSISSLEKNCGLERQYVDKYLNMLMHKGLVESRINKNNKMRYFLSSRARELLGELSSE